MEEAMANRFLGKGGTKDALYIGATRAPGKRGLWEQTREMRVVWSGWASTEGLHTEEPAGIAEDL
ncbi:hypothetical protein Pmar_PMAR012147 [Perkinsus marinus ATCC 50983]|uniref:Uncharacterized protein n=1 Tax=Perkinsus marinus (strain ATCC 50983 / TXsc) TaxID=423536 RepID=C5L611_PERM5|nr:hypothetical protein Pmar_PMAR012147 [Perkinsus marinus ATCC 50983]EER07830.1 hypothetical protein Pmar_PMAR012147 [Perkinsus marinus ATCC 50983]|eukprot:XP_002776014.1 hypothetical protein Pmar_PMAR012147 [Perkinsus marinus ATCC 50983]